MRHQTIIIIIVIIVGVLVGFLANCVENTAEPALIEYRRTGGIAGLDDHLIIDAKGRAVLARKAERYEFVLDRYALNQLVTILDATEFSALCGDQRPLDAGADLYEYVVTYEGCTVRTADTTVPESLRSLLDLLNNLVERVSDYSQEERSTCSYHEEKN